VGVSDFGHGARSSTDRRSAIDIKTGFIRDCPAGENDLR
jgi:hypothetical protein